MPRDRQIRRFRAPVDRHASGSGHHRPRYAGVKTRLVSGESHKYRDLGKLIGMVAAITTVWVLFLLLWD